MIPTSGPGIRGPSARADKARDTMRRRHCIKAVRKALNAGWTSIQAKFEGDGTWQREKVKQEETLDSNMAEYQWWWDHREETAQKSTMSQAELNERYGNRPHIKQRNAGGTTVPTRNLPDFTTLVKQKRALDENQEQR